MSHDVFISYSHRDKPVGDAMCAALESRHIRCWIAPRDVLPGSPWGEAIIDAINGCRVLVLIYSADSNGSHQVIREVERAVSKGIPILPFRIEDVPLSKSMEYCISTHHWLDALTPPLEKHLSQLAETVQLLLMRSGISRDGADASPPSDAYELAIRSEPAAPTTVSVLPRSLLLGISNAPSLVVVPRGAELPFVSVHEFFVEKSDREVTLRIQLYIGASDQDGSDIPYGPLNAVKGDIVVVCPAGVEGKLTLEFCVDAQQQLRMRGWCASAPDIALTVMLDTSAQSGPARKRLHLYERLKKVEPDARQSRDSEIEAAVEKKHQLERLCSQFYATGNQDDLFHQIIAQGKELLADIELLEEKYAPASLAEVAVPIAIPAGEPDTVRCPHCREHKFKMSPPTQGHIFDCARCKKSFWYGVGSPPEFVQLQFAVEDAVRSGDWRSLSQWIDFARKAGKPVYFEAWERGLWAGMTGDYDLAPDAPFLDFLSTLGESAVEQKMKSALFRILINGVNVHLQNMQQAYILAVENSARIQQGDQSALSTARSSLMEARDETYRARDVAIKVKSICPNDSHIDELLKICRKRADELEKLCRQNSV